MMTYTMNQQKTTIYLDTCVYINKLRWEEGFNMLHHGEEALKLMNRIEAGEFTLVISNHLESQLKYIASDTYKEFKEYIAKINKNNDLIFITSIQKDRDNAKEMAKKDPDIEYDDAIHAEIAIRAGADILITRNMRHFASYNEKIKIRLPENIDLDF